MHRDPERRIILAVPIDILNTSFQKRIFGIAVKEIDVALCGYDPESEEIVEWIV